MSYEVLARKWRPQQFDDVVGQEHVTRTLKNAIATGRIAHAYLFVGPRGIGKTSIARIFAKALNCKGGPKANPCDACDACREIMAGNCMDVIEIDGASNNGVDQVRDLREAVKYAPVRSPFKIYIIDEVHMLTTAAFNALLKTLEEPPPHVKFIFATTEPEKVLATIVSRCQRFDLRRIPAPQIVERLRLIVKEEKVKADEDALLAIARGAEGGLRDAESALDQIISFKGTKISEEDVLSVFGLVARSTLEELGGNILKGDAAGILATVGRLDEGGKDLQRVVVELLGHFRNLLVLQHVKDAGRELDLTEGQIATLRAHAALADTERILRVADLLSEAEERMRFALSKRILLETALIRCARAATVVSLDEILAKLLDLQGGAPAAVAVPAPTVSRPAAAPATPAPYPAVAPAADAVEEDAEETLFDGPPDDEPLAAPLSAAPAVPQDDVAKLAAQWPAILDKLGRLAMRARQALVAAGAQPVRVDGARVTLGMDPEFPAEEEVFKSPRNRGALEGELSRALGRAVKVVFEAAADASPAPAPSPARPPAPAKAGARVAGPAAPPGASPAGGTRSRRDLLDDPVVKKAREIFNADVMDVREG